MNTTHHGHIILERQSNPAPVTDANALPIEYSEYNQPYFINYTHSITNYEATIYCITELKALAPFH